MRVHRKRVPDCSAKCQKAETLVWASLAVPRNERRDRIAALRQPSPVRLGGPERRNEAELVSGFRSKFPGSRHVRLTSLVPV